MPYDSDGGRALAATLTAFMTGVAYKTSAELAIRLEPFSRYSQDAESVLQVLEMHRDAIGKIDEKLVSPKLFAAATQIWDETLELAREHGVRNAQATLLVPTGTIRAWEWSAAIPHDRDESEAMTTVIMSPPSRRLPPVRL